MAPPKKPKKEKERPSVTAAYINKCGVYEAELRQVCIRLLGARPLDAFKWTPKEKTEFFLENIETFSNADLGQLDKNMFTEASLTLLAQLQEYIGGVGDTLPKYPITLDDPEVPTGVEYSPEETWEVSDDEEDAEPEEEDLVDITVPIPVQVAVPKAAVAEAQPTEIKERKMPPTFKRATLGTAAKEPEKAPPVAAPAAAPAAAAKVVAKPAAPAPVAEKEPLDPLVEEVATLREAVAGLTETIERQGDTLHTILEMVTHAKRTGESTSQGLMAMINATIVPEDEAPITDMSVFLPEIP